MQQMKTLFQIISPLPGGTCLFLAMALALAANPRQQGIRGAISSQSFSIQERTSAADSRWEAVSTSDGPDRGRRLFLKNCAHCHGEEARGDEGPDLHGIKKSDEWIARRIRDGVKGEMTAFGEKFSDQDIRDLIAYLRSLKD